MISRKDKLEKIYEIIPSGPIKHTKASDGIIMIGDIFGWLHDLFNFYDLEGEPDPFLSKEISSMWRDPKKPIDIQSEETISLVYDLVIAHDFQEG